jgi:hypothetical protein
VLSLLEVHNRKGTTILRAVGVTAIVAAVAIQLIRLTAIIVLIQMGGPLLP